MKENLYDAIILGAGPSGVSAGLYLVRSNKKVLIIYSSNLGALKDAISIENYYATGKISGNDLYKKGISDLKNIGADVIDGNITGVSQDYENGNFVVTIKNQEYKAKTIILALGKQIKNSKDYKMNATQKVSYCATCDGFFYKKKKIAVVGAGEFAYAEFNHLKNVTHDITIFTSGKPECDEIKLINDKVKDQILEINNINDKVEIKTQNQHYIFDGVFICEGEFGVNNVTATIGVETQNGFIAVDKKMQTNIDGVFACGDCIGAPFQVAKAVYDGMIAGLECISYLNSKL